ncbi:MAG: Holliday junction resolvase RuvX [Oscillospiraceae bacterium]|jgi:putative Holliday junction resolvase|nr:Holliday junction resolvase RuvX [Oscillospiraceae bacterium]
MVILAVDYGDVRTGVAVCDKLEMIAVPVCVIAERNQDVLIEKIAEIVKERRVEMAVVGLPKNMDGSVGFRAEACAAFAKRLEERTAVPVALWDERLTTVSAHNLLNETGSSGAKRKKIIDAVAATMILQSFLDYRKNQKQ